MERSEVRNTGSEFCYSRLDGPQTGPVLVSVWNEGEAAENLLLRDD